VPAAAATHDNAATATAAAEVRAAAMHDTGAVSAATTVTAAVRGHRGRITQRRCAESGHCCDCRNGEPASQ
jgi:hypothetical protein